MVEIQPDSRKPEDALAGGNPPTKFESFMPTVPVGFTTPDFVSRSGLKLHAALHTWNLPLNNCLAADLGCNVGGFVQCLLAQGAARVYAVDTGYGVLAWKLRRDPRVVVMERVNALHLQLPELVDAITVDIGWTPQDKILPAAARLLKPNGWIITLIKPHYESADARRQKGVLQPAQSLVVLRRVLGRITQMNLTVRAVVQSPIAGHGGNMEYLAHLTLAANAPPTR